MTDGRVGKQHSLHHGNALRTDLPCAHQTDICMTCRLWVLLVCLNGVAASPQNYTHPKVVAVRDVFANTFSEVRCSCVRPRDGADCDRLWTVSVQ